MKGKYPAKGKPKPRKGKKAAKGGKMKGGKKC